MKLLEVASLAFAALRERRTRSILTILMIVIGIGLVVSLNGLGAGFSTYIERQFSLLSPNALIITPSTQFEGGPSSGRRVELDFLTVNNIKRIKGVADVIPVIQGGVTIKSAGKSIRTLVMGLDQTKIDSIFPTFELEIGKIVFPQDTVGVLLGSEVKRPPGRATPFAKEGQTITLEYSAVETVAGTPKDVTRKRDFLVRGSVVNMGSGAFLGIDSSITISLKAADSFLQRGGKYSSIFVLTNSVDLNDKVEKEIRKIYGENIGIASPKAIIETFQGFAAGFSIFIGAIANISLLVAAVGVGTTLITSVMERTREIGLLKALGFKEKTILILFLSEALIIGAIGGSVGIIAGIILGSAIVPLMSFGPGFQLTPQFFIEDLFSAWLFAIIISAIAGLYPAWRASKLDPVVALRKE